MPKQKLSTLIKRLNEENAPPAGWTPKDSVDKPEAGKTYALTGGPGSRCIANGFSWKDSEVQQEELQPKLGSRCS
jgi:hypothetical protein